MEKTLCFIIDQKNIYLDIVLVELNFPLLFVCKDEEGHYYMAMCIDACRLIYLVTACKPSDISDMILGNTTIRYLWENSAQCWKIFTADEMEKDNIEIVCIDDIMDSELPEKGEKYIIENDDIRKYALLLADNQIYDMKIKIDFYVRGLDEGELYIEFDRHDNDSDTVYSHYFTIREDKRSVKEEDKNWENVFVSPAA